MIVCPVCGERSRAGARRCWSCNADLTTVKAADPEQHDVESVGPLGPSSEAPGGDAHEARDESSGGGAGTDVTTEGTLNESETDHKPDKPGWWVIPATIVAVFAGIAIGILGMRAEHWGPWSLSGTSATPAATYPPYSSPSPRATPSHRPTPHPKRSPSPSPSPSPTPTISPTPGAATPAPVATLADGALLGHWYGSGAAQSLLEVDVFRGPAGLTARAYGACAGTRCDFGIAPLQFSDGFYSAAFGGGAALGSLILFGSATSAEARSRGSALNARFTYVRGRSQYLVTTTLARGPGAGGPEHFTRLRVLPGGQKVRASPTATPTSSPTVISSSSTTLTGKGKFSFDTGIGGASAGDVLWEHEPQATRRLAPQDGALVVNLGNVGYENLTPESLATRKYGDAPIVGTDDRTNQLVPGDVFAVKTRAGNYAKVQVLDYGATLTIRWTTYHLGSSP